MLLCNRRRKKKLEKLVINENTCAVNSDIVGKSAQYIADLVGITVPEHTKMLVAEIQGIGAAYPLSREKLSPVLACVKANSLEEGFTYCEEMLNLGGLGHSAVIHSTNKDVQKQFGLRMKACRLIVNAPSSQGGIGIYIMDLFHHLHLVVVHTERIQFPKM